MKWNNAINDYKLYLKIERGLSHNSIENYARDISKLAYFLDENKILDTPITISDIVIQQFIYELAKTEMHVLNREQYRDFVVFLTI